MVPSKGWQKYSQSLHVTKSIKGWPFGSLGLNTDLTMYQLMCTCTARFMKNGVNEKIILTPVSEYKSTKRKVREWRKKD